MPDWNILLTDGLSKNGVSILREAAHVDERDGIQTQELVEIVPSYDAIIVRGRTKLTEQVINAAARLKVIGRAGVGVDNIDLPASKRRGITVVNTPTATTQAVSELTMGLVYALARMIPLADASMKAGHWAKREFQGVEISGKTLGIIGMGRIGSTVARMAVTAGMRVLGCDSFKTDYEISRTGALPASFPEVLVSSDFISLHVPLMDSTRAMIDLDAISQMKPGVRLISTARGGIIEERALLHALDSGHVAAAALDVFTQEPPGATRLVTHPSVIASPHIGAQTIEAQSRAAEIITNEVLAALRGEALRWKVV